MMMGGLALCTLITLGLIPALYAAAYRVALRDLPAKYDKAINSVRTSFYNQALAAKAKLRVEV